MKKTKILVTFLAVSLIIAAIGAFGMPAAASAEAPSIDYATVVFKDAVDLRYFVKSSDEGTTELLIWTAIPENKEFTKATADDVLTDYYNDSVSVSGSTYKAFTYDKVAARQMGDTYYVRALYTVGSTELYSEVVKYSIQQYALNMLGLSGKPAYSGDDADTLLPLLESMLDYGACAQKYFDHNTDRLVNADTVSVEVSGGVISEDGMTHGIYYPGDAVELTAPATNADGMPFSHWEDQDGNEVTVPYTVSGEEGSLLTLIAVYTVDVVITATDAEAYEDNDYDLTTMFSITANGEQVDVTADMINNGGFNGASSAVGEYKIVLTYTSSDGVTYTATATLTVKSTWIGPF